MWSPAGHIAFNKIHLQALGQIGDIYTVFKEGYYKYDYPHVTHYLDIPSQYYKNGEGYYRSRLRLSRMTRWVWNQVSKEKWDYVILSSYDPLALFLSQRFKDAIVIDHNTIALLDNKRLGFPLRHLSKGLRHIVFNDHMKSRFNVMGFDNVSVVPHGFMPMNSKPLSIDEENRIRQKYSLGPKDGIIFLPSLSISSVDLVGQSIYNDDFNDFLKENKLKLITKSRVKRESKSNIIIVDSYLLQEEYEYLFLNSSCNVLFYSPDFKYRTSGVLNECFANNVPCVFSECPALEAYRSYINNSHCVFHDGNELKESILSALMTGRKDYFKNIGDIENPLEGWRQILNCS